MTDKQQIIMLVGGESSRFYPFNSKHKSFFNIAGKSIIHRTLENIFSKIDSEVILVLAKSNFKEDKAVIEKFGFGEKIKFATQDKPLGQADSILSAKKFIKRNFFVVNPQQTEFADYFGDFVTEHNRTGALAIVGNQVTHEPQKYGILKFDGSNVVGVVEKPELKDAPSNKRIVGIYYFDKEFIAELEKTKLSYYSLEETLNRIGSLGKLATVEIKEDLLSLKYPWDIFKFKDLFLSNIKRHISSSAKISDTSLIRGEVFIDENASVYDFAIIDGPAYIGRNAVVGVYCQVRGGTILEADAQIERYADSKNSYIGMNTHIHSGFIGDSIIGDNVRIGAGFTTANKRIDRDSVKVEVGGEKINTNQKSIGVFVGDNSKLGINVSTMPGAIIGTNSVIYPCEIVKGTLKTKNNE